MPKYLSTEEKAQQMGIKPETLRRMARSGKINCIKCDTGIKSRYRFYPWQIIRRDSWRLATRSETGERNQSNGRYMPCPISHGANHKEAELRRRLFRDERSLTYRTKQYMCNKVTVSIVDAVTREKDAQLYASPLSACFWVATNELHLSFKDASGA